MNNQKITFTLKGNDWTISTVTLKEYYEIYNDIQRDDIDSHFNIVAKLSGCDSKDLRSLEAKNWRLLWASVVGMLNSYFSQDIQQITQEFTFGGVKYGLVNMNKMTIGEFADLDSLTNSEDLHKRYHELLAILYRPIVKKNFFTKEIMAYDEINYEEQAELFKELPLYHVKSAISFFLRSANQSLENTGTYLEKHLKQMNLTPEEEKKLRSAVSELLETGGSLLTNLPKNSPSIYVKLPSLQSEKDSTGLPGNKTQSKRRSKQSKTLEQK